MKKLRIPLLIVLAVTPLFANAQIEQSSFTATGRGGVSTAFSTDYQSLGINPANLGIKTEFRFAYGFLDFTSSLSSQALTKQDIRNDILKIHDFTLDQKKEFAKKFADDGLAMNTSLMALGFSARIPVVGGVAITIRNQFSLNMKLSPEFSDILFNGRNAAYFDQKVVVGTDTVGIPSQPKSAADIVRGSNINLLSYNEYIFGYGRSTISLGGLKLIAGFSVKYIEGLGIMQLDNDGADLNAYAAFSPGFNVDYGNISSPSDLNGGGFFKSVGDGIAVDLGFTGDINDKTTLAVALTNIGSITWKGNVYEIENDTITSLKSEGLNSANIFENDIFFGDSGVVKWKGIQEKKVAMPTVFRIGAKKKFGERFAIGADVVLPLSDVPGALRDPAIAVGGDIRLGGFVFSTGVSLGGNNGFNLPVGIILSPVRARYEAGIATRDITTFLGENSPTISAAFGFLRFKI